MGRDCGEPTRGKKLKSNIKILNAWTQQMCAIYFKAIVIYKLQYRAKYQFMKRSIGRVKAAVDLRLVLALRSVCIVDRADICFLILDMIDATV